MPPEEAALSARLKSLGQRLDQAGPARSSEAAAFPIGDRCFGVRARFPALLRADRGCAGRSGSWLADRPLARILAVGDVRVRALRLLRRSAECDASGRSRSGGVPGLRRRGRKRSIAPQRRAKGQTRPNRPWPIRSINSKSSKFFTIGHIGGQEIAFTNSSLYMVIAVGVIGALLVGMTASRSLVPGRLQSLAELSYEFVATTIRSTAGTEGMRFFPLVFSLFMFILVVNMIGLIPYTFTVTSHIIITIALALLVFLTVVIYGFCQARPALLQAVRAERHPDLHPAAGRVHRGVLVLPAAGLAQHSPVREHARRPHRAEGVRELHSAAGRPRHHRRARRRRFRSAW